MDTMTLMRLRAAQNSRMNRHRLLPANLSSPTRTVSQPAFRMQVQSAPQQDDPLTKLVDLGLQIVVPVQYQVVKTGGAVLESPAVPSLVKVLVSIAVTAAVISGGKEIGRTLDNLLS